MHRLNPLLHPNTFYYNHCIWVLYLITYDSNSATLKDTRQSWMWSCVVFQALESFKAGSRLRTGKLSSTVQRYVQAYVLMRCLLHRANTTQFNKSYRRALNVTKLFGMQTLASQPRSLGWLSQPWGHWQCQQLAAADSWIFVDSRTQTRAECKHPIYASMQF